MVLEPQTLSLNVFIILNVFVNFQLLKDVALWLKHDWENRKTHAAALLKKLRLGLVKVEDLNQYLDEQIRGIPECEEVYKEVIKIHGIADAEKAERLADCPDKTGGKEKGSWFARHYGLYQPMAERFPDMCASRTTVTVSIKGL